MDNHFKGKYASRYIDIPSESADNLLFLLTTSLYENGIVAADNSSGIKV